MADRCRTRGGEGAGDGYPDLETMLAEADIDCVVAATPEHSHILHIKQTLDADKDIFIEKPMTHTWEEGVEVVRLNEKKRKIIQVGTQRRSVDIYYTARDLVQSGAIGEITQCKGWWHRNSKATDPQWRYPLPEGATEDTINWRKFLYNAPKVPFDINRYFQWRCYWDYSNGPAGDLMVHQLDAINIVMGGEMPDSAMGMGSIYRFHELGRTTPDTWNAILEFPARDRALGLHGPASACSATSGTGTADILRHQRHDRDERPRDEKVIPSGTWQTRPSRGWKWLPRSGATGASHQLLRVRPVAQGAELHGEARPLRSLGRSHGRHEPPQGQEGPVGPPAPRALHPVGLPKAHTSRQPLPNSGAAARCTLIMCYRST